MDYVLFFVLFMQYMVISVLQCLHQTQILHLLQYVFEDDRFSYIRTSYTYIGFNATTPLASDFVVPVICGKDRVNRKNKNHVIEEEAKGL